MKTDYQLLKETLEKFEADFAEYNDGEYKSIIIINENRDVEERGFHMFFDKITEKYIEI